MTKRRHVYDPRCSCQPCTRERKRRLARNVKKNSSGGRGGATARETAKTLDYKKRKERYVQEED